MSGAPDHGGFEVVKVFFPLIGIAMTVGSVIYGVYITQRASAYEQAFAAYKKRRAAVKPEDFR